MKEGRCLIIGGGPAGLTAATRPQIKPIAFVLGEFSSLGDPMSSADVGLVN
jgi:thioredoxin reductase